MENKLKSKLLLFECLCLVFCLIFSFINHFLYEWTNNSLLVAPFVPVNESVWEHAKLLFFPFLFFSIFEFFYFNDLKNCIFAKSLALLVCTPLMIIIFYTYTGIIGQNYLIADILLAIAIIVFMNYLSYKIIICNHIFYLNWIFIFVIIMFFLFFIFTFYPPRIPLFIDTTTGLYGVN